MGHFQDCMNVKIPVPKRVRVLKNSVVKFYIPAVWYMLLLEEDYFGKISKKIPHTGDTESLDRCVS